MLGPQERSSVAAHRYRGVEFRDDYGPKYTQNTLVGHVVLL